MTRVSIVIPCFNAAPFIEECVASALGQSHAEVEIVVVDDGSTDDSWRKILGFGGRVRALRGRRRGACAARNRGARKATGKYLVFLDADDVLGPNMAETLVQVLRDRDIAIAGCDWRRLRLRQGRWVAADNELAPVPPEGDYLLGWIGGWYVSLCALMWTREAFEGTGGWDESLSANQDGDLVMRALIDGVELVRATGACSFYRAHDGGRKTVSSTRSVAALQSRVRVLEKLEARLTGSARCERYRIAIGARYASLARNNFSVHADLAGECLERARVLAGSRAVEGTLLHRALVRILGLERKERLTAALGRAGLGRRKRRELIARERGGGAVR